MISPPLEYTGVVDIRISHIAGFGFIIGCWAFRTSL